MQKPAATPAELTLRQGDQFSAVPAPSWDFGGDCVNGVHTVVLLPEKGQTTDKVVFTINRDRKVTDDEAPFYLTVVGQGVDADVVEQSSVVNVAFPVTIAADVRSTGTAPHHLEVSLTKCPPR